MAPSNTTQSSVPAKRALPSKEAGLFKELLQLYETRQLKKGQKTADQILKKFPDHGETLSMKGLILTNMGKRDEGLELVKKGIRLDLTSHICWHVFGLIQKAGKNYEEALKSYTQALRFDKENLNILRDAAHLQTQLCLYDALVDTRHTLLKLRPNLRQNWIALAVAYHLNKNLSEAKKVLESYESTLKSIPDYDFEHSETLLYHIRLLEEMGEYSEALNILDINAKSRAIVDRTSIMEFRARLLSKTGDSEAEHAWRALIEQNAECYDHYKGFLKTKGINFEKITDENRLAALDVLHEFSTSMPRAAAPRRLGLTIATGAGDPFAKLAKPYLLSALANGSPSLFVDVKTLYADPHKRQVIETITSDYRKELEADSSSDPTTYLWTLYFLAQHHSHLSRNDVALDLINMAIAHTPTLPELYTFKGRIHKRVGDPFTAARCVDEARQLDGQDRFLNTKCAKYRFRAGAVEEANEVLGYFTKKDAASPGADLEDMQSLFYLLEEGDAHFQTGKWSLALRRYHGIQKLFDEIEDDQFDFHGYSVRKFIINSYLELLKWEAKLRSHPAYVSAALSASSIYIQLHDDPSLTTRSSSGVDSDADAAEKKAKKKAKKAVHKAQPDPKKASNASAEDRGLEPPPPKDDDPDGMKLLTTPGGLERAAKLLSPLATLASSHIDVWLAIYDVAIRRKKYLQGVKALKTAYSLDTDDGELHVRIADFHARVSSAQELLPEPIERVAREALRQLVPPELSLAAFNSQYLQRHGGRSARVFAAARAARIAGAPLGEVEEVVFSTLMEGSDLTIKTGQSAASFLDTVRSSRAAEYRAACAARFPLSSVFGTREELRELRRRGVVADLAASGGEAGEKEEQAEEVAR